MQAIEILKQATREILKVRSIQGREQLLPIRIALSAPAAAAERALALAAERCATLDVTDEEAVAALSTVRALLGIGEDDPAPPVVVVEPDQDEQRSDGEDGARSERKKRGGSDRQEKGGHDRAQE